MSPDLAGRPRFLDAGEAALVVEFGSMVDPAISDRVLALDAALAIAVPEGIRELVPTYRSLMIHYDPLRLGREALVALVEERLAAPVARTRAASLWTIPCCYEEPHGEDLAELAAIMAMSPERAAEIHAGATYRVYMYGFAPGFTYLGGLPPEIAISRRSKPRRPHDTKAVVVGGGLSAIATFSMPTGWYVVGRTPERARAIGRLPDGAGRQPALRADRHCDLLRAGRARRGGRGRRPEPVIVTAVLSVLLAGPGSTIQDRGRHGYLRYGVTGAGPMDPFAHALANRALGNPAGEAAIVVSLGGIEVTAEGGPVTVAVAGGAFAATLDGQALPPALVAVVEPGAKLKLRAGAEGAWCYLAVAGGFDLPRVLGSTSTHTRTAIGGIEGRGLMTGDRLAIGAASSAEIEAGQIAAPLLERPADMIRVILGPQDDYFASDQIAAFLAGPWTVSTRGDRMACFLEGPKLTHARGYNIASDGIAMGAIQVPGEGQPIVLMADRQSTGGYPKIATVIGPDLGRLAQARPGNSFCFQAVTHAQAVAARAAEQAFLSAAIPVEPLIRRHFASEFLLGLNLVDGWVDAHQSS